MSTFILTWVYILTCSLNSLVLNIVFYITSTESFWHYCYRRPTIPFHKPRSPSVVTNSLHSIASCEHCHVKKAPKSGRVIWNFPSEYCLYHGYSTLMVCFFHVDTGHRRVLAISTIKKAAFQGGVKCGKSAADTLAVEVYPSTAPIL